MCFPAFGWNRISERLEAGVVLPPRPQLTCSGRALAPHKEGVVPPSSVKSYKKGSNVNSKRKSK